MQPRRRVSAEVLSGTENGEQPRHRADVYHVALGAVLPHAQTACARGRVGTPKECSVKKITFDSCLTPDFRSIAECRVGFQESYNKMSGILHSVCTRRTFTFSNVATSNSVEIPLMRALEITGSKALELIVRIHTYNIGTGANIAIKAYPISLSPEEPDLDCVASAVATVTISAGSGTGVLQLGSLSTPFGHMVKVTITGTQPGSSQTITATLSIDLLAYDN